MAKRKIVGPVEAFSLAPLLSIIPGDGGTDRLESFTASFFARYEKVRDLRSASGVSKDVDRHYASEEAMLRQVLDWLAVKTTEQNNG
jgi:hypothetical protein